MQILKLIGVLKQFKLARDGVKLVLLYARHSREFSVRCLSVLVCVCLC